MGKLALTRASTPYTLHRPRVKADIYEDGGPGAITAWLTLGWVWNEAETDHGKTPLPVLHDLGLIVSRELAIDVTEEALRWAYALHYVKAEKGSVTHMAVLCKLGSIKVSTMSELRGDVYI